jgi:hypothetical protein
MVHCYLISSVILHYREVLNESSTTRISWLDQNRDEFRQKLISNSHRLNSIIDDIDCNSFDSNDYCVARFSKVLSESGEPSICPIHPVQEIPTRLCTFCAIHPCN